VFKACTALEVRVRSQSGLDLSGRDLMSRALSGDDPPINVAVEDGQSGRDEQEGIRFLLMGVMQGIRNPKGHGLVRQDDPQRALEYLAVGQHLVPPPRRRRCDLTRPSPAPLRSSRAAKLLTGVPNVRPSAPPSVAATGSQRTISCAGQRQRRGTHGDSERLLLRACLHAYSRLHE